MSKIVITTLGSLGDLHPYIAIALGLQNRGHEVIIATSECHQNKIESSGLKFHNVRPDSDWLLDPEKVRRLSHPRLGLLRVGREWLMPSLKASYEDILDATENTDLIFSMHAHYATRLVAEKTKTPWVSAMHIPMGLFSVFDPPVLDVAPGLSRKLQVLGPAFWGPLFWLSKRATRFLARTWYQLRSEINLPPTHEGNPLADSHSPLLVLALFSKLLAEKQPDWPESAVITGFPFYETNTEVNLPQSLVHFLNSGSPPIVFTLGSAVSINGKSFWQESVNCAKSLNRRAVLIVGTGNQQQCQVSSSDDVLVVEYAPFSQLFPQVSAVVHHGGIGTTGLAMRAGCPMLVVPQAWDQPDNAARAEKLGIARIISQSKYTADRTAKELLQLLENPIYVRRAKEIGELVVQEEGVANACDALENIL